MRIILASEEHMERILELEREAISPPWTHGKLLGELYSGDSYFALATESEPSPAAGPGGILGFVILRVAADECELYQIAVAEAHRRRAVADALMASAFDWARGRGATSMHLEVRRSNEAAIALYRKHGFVTVRTRRDYYTDPVEDATVMSRGL
jgi:ribosomal-protein-alanine N-acetyltransferase